GEARNGFEQSLSGGRLPTELVIDAGAENVVPELGSTGKIEDDESIGQRQREGFHHAAEVHVEIFELRRPISDQDRLYAGARDPAGLGLIGAGGTDVDAVVECDAAVLPRPGGAAGHVPKPRVECVAGAAARCRKPIERLAHRYRLTTDRQGAAL